MTARSIHVLPFALACFLAALAVPVQAGTADAPEVVDAPGDATLRPLDLAAVWFEATETDLVVHIQRAEGADSPPAIVTCQQGHCAGAGVSLRVVFTVLDPDGTPTPDLEGYAASYVLVRIGPDDPTFAAATGYYNSDGTATLLGSANATADGLSLNVTLPRSNEILALPVGATPGPYRISEPYALSYVMACAPEEGCLNAGAVEQAASAWDRAPDTGFGSDFVFPSPPPPPPPAPVEATGLAVTSTTTVTVVQVNTEVVTATVTETHTSTPLPLIVEAKGTPAAGIAAVVAALGAVLLARRRLA